MSMPSSNHDTSSIRASMGPRRPAAVGKIEKAQNPRGALSRLLPYLKPFKRAMIAVMIFVLLYTVVGLVGPYLMGVAIDRFISTKNVSGLLPIALWMLAAYVLNNVFQAVAGWIMSGVSQRALKQVRRDLFAHLQ